MNKVISIFVLFLATTLMGYADDDVIVDGVVYHLDNGEYVVTGCDDSNPHLLRSLHILAVVNGLDVTRIDGFAFEDNTDIVCVKIDEGITSIGQNAFCRCTNIETVILPEGLVNIEQEAFAYCSKITTMVIPSTVRRIDDKAFMYCTGVTDAYFLMLDYTELNDFSWVDGVYSQPGEEQFGGLEFNTNRNTVIRVPYGTRQRYVNSGKFEAWLGKIQEDDNIYPLWWIVNFGVVGREYTVSDRLTAVYVDKNGCLYAKDQGFWLTPDIAYDDEVDYMKASGLLAKRGNVYDQSNWVTLQDLESPQNLVDYSINGETITGILRDKTNPSIEVSSTLQRGETDKYVANTYIAASLMSRTQIGADSRTYAFVRPKPQEYADFQWTIYGGNLDFYMPAPDDESNINAKCLKGGFNISDYLYEEASMPDLVHGGHYPFKAIIMKKTEDAESPVARRLKAESAIWPPYTEGGVSQDFTVYPLKLPDEPIITTIERITTDDTPDNDAIYDMQGRRVVNPSRGIYISHSKKIIVN